MDQLPNLTANLNEPRSEEDILEILNTAVKKYDMMGSAPILPLTASEFRTLRDRFEEAIDE